MANISGTNVAAPIRPFSTEDSFPTALSNEIQGGLHSTDTKANMFKIPAARRDLGMLVYVDADKRFYQLKINPSTEETQDSDWDDALIASSILFPDGKNLEEKFDQTTSATSDRHMIFNLQDADNTGSNGIELRVPFKASIKSIDAAVPIAATLDSSGIEFKVETYNAIASNWVEVKTVRLDNTSTNNSVSVAVTGIVVEKMTRFRINVTATIPSIKNLEVIITLESEG